MKEIFQYMDSNGFTEITEEIKFNGSNSEYLEFKYILIFNVKYEFISNLVFPDIFFEHTFFANDITLSNNDDLKQLIVPYDEPEYFSFSLIVKDKLHDDLQNKFYFFSEYGAENFIVEFSKIKSNKLPTFKEKILLETYLSSINWVLNQTHSPIFLINKNDPEPLSSKTITNLETLKKKELVIGLLPRYIQDEVFSIIPLLPLLKSLLSTIANDTNKNSVYIKGRYNLRVNTDNEYDYDTMLAHFKGLNTLYYFIYSNDVSADQKKTFVRKSICNNLSKDEVQNLSELNPTYFDEIYKDANYLFETFENGEVSIFLKEKKEILKEYMSFSKDVLSNINSIKDNLNKTLRTVITILLVNFSVRLIPRFENSSDFKLVSSLFLLIGTLYTILSIIIFIKSDYPSYKLIKNKSTIFEKQFNFFSSKTDAIKDDYSTLIETDLKNYKDLLCTILTIYLLIFGFLLIFLLTGIITN